LIVAVERFRAIALEMQAVTMLTLLYVGQRGTCVQKDLEAALAVSHPATSRNVGYWTSKGTHGLDYMERFRHPRNRRANQLRPTPAGRAFYEEITGVRSPGDPE
jgi:DNA-binding MarR family transcriptional regulator